MRHLTVEQKRYVIRTSLIYGAIIFIFSILQTSFFSRLLFFGAIPNIMLIVVIGASIYEGERTGAVVGIAAGVFIEAQGGIGIPILPLLLFLVGYFYGIMSKQFVKDGFFIYLIYMVVGCLVGSVVTLIQTALFASNYNLPQILKNIILPEYIYTLLLSIPCYPLFKLIKNPTQAQNNTRTLQ
jgi:rod shape-determining protein MreD